MQLPQLPQLSHPRRALARSAAAPLPDGATFVGIALLVMLGDLVTKAMAVGLWSGERYPLVGSHLLIEVVHNPLGAFSTSYGAHTFEINVAATLAAALLAMVYCPRLTRFDALAPSGLGLITGAALGNLASLVTSPGGVPDFLAVAHGQGSVLVLNLADVAAYIGLACCARIAWSVLRAAVATARGH
ncbi:MAG: signal peptidase II [Gemmatimonadaceae bacterium]